MPAPRPSRRLLRHRPHPGSAHACTDGGTVSSCDPADVRSRIGNEKFTSVPDKVIRDTLLTANAVLALDGVHTTTEGLKLMRRRSVAVGALAAATALLVSACGGSSGSSSGGGGASTALEGVGPITLVQGKDTSNFVQGQLDKWNQQHPGSEGHPDRAAGGRRRPAPADDPERQREVRRLRRPRRSTTSGRRSSRPTATSSSCPQDQFPNTAEFLPPVIDSAKYKDKLYAVPYASDGGMLYYRTDLLQAAGIAAPPKTWAGDDRRLQEDPGARRRARASTATPVSSRSTRA